MIRIQCLIERISSVRYLSPGIYILSISALFFLFTAVPHILRADTVHLRNGKQIYGKIVNESQTEVKIHANGANRTLYMKDIRRIQYGTKDPAEEAERLADEKPPGRFDIMWRSALLPGWGQLHADQPVAGIASAGLFGAGLILTLHIRNQAVTAKSNYDQSGILFLGSVAAAGATGANVPPEAGLAAYYLFGERSFAGYNERVEEANMALLFTGLVYLGQLTYAWFISPEPKAAISSENRYGGIDFVFVPEQVNGSSGSRFQFRYEVSY